MTDRSHTRETAEEQDPKCLRGRLPLKDLLQTVANGAAVSAGGGSASALHDPLPSQGELGIQFDAAPATAGRANTTVSRHATTRLT